MLKQLVACLRKKQYCLAQRKFDRDTWQVQKGERFNLISSITFKVGTGSYEIFSIERPCTIINCTHPLLNYFSHNCQIS